ncbi:hypothetical protein [Helicobacter gastrocanis]|uniref:hypothetical protein n=1 Tax=Helicobacter gastrocanis TaxID=2849641 RepID=UPI001C85D7D6|nr:hypothetical protein [Helicobacter sp. NHP19-003]
MKQEYSMADVANQSVNDPREKLQALLALQKPRAGRGWRNQEHRRNSCFAAFDNDSWDLGGL